MTGVMPKPLTSRHTFGRLIVISPENGAILSADHYSIAYNARQIGCQGLLLLLREVWLSVRRRQQPRYKAKPRLARIEGHKNTSTGASGTAKSAYVSYALFASAAMVLIPKFGRVFPPTVCSARHENYGQGPFRHSGGGPFALS